MTSALAVKSPCGTSAYRHGKALDKLVKVCLAATVVRSAIEVFFSDGGEPHTFLLLRFVKLDDVDLVERW